MAATQGYYNTLHVLRSDVWSYIREKCPSFVRMDCNAQFSEIFCTNVFFNLTDIQKKNILSQYIQNGFCSDCQRNLRVNNQVFLYYVSLPQVVLAGYFMSDLPNQGPSGINFYFFLTALGHFASSPFILNRLNQENVGKN